MLTGAVSLLGPLLAAEGSQLVRAAAVRALADIALLYGPAAADAVLRRPCPGSLFGEGEDAESREGGASSSCKGLLELLIEQGQTLLTEAQAGAAHAAKKSGRWVVEPGSGKRLCFCPVQHWLAAFVGLWLRL
jgi:hypothetical protein